MNKNRIIIFVIVLWQILPWGTAAQVKVLDPVAHPGMFHIHDVAPAEGFAARFVSSVFQDQYGYIWIGTQYGTHLYDGYNLTDIRLMSSDSMYSMLGSVQHFFDDQDGGVWLCGFDRLYYYDRVRNTLVPQRKFTNHYARWRNGVAGIYQDKRGMYWLFTGSGMILWNRETDESVHTEIPPQSSWGTHSINDDFNPLETDDGSVWIPTGTNGLYRYLPDKQEFVNYRHEPSDPNSISSDNVTDVLADTEGNLWISTYGGGLNILKDKDKGIFEHIRYEPGVRNAIPSDSLSELMMDRAGNIWIAGMGLSRYRTKEKEFSLYYIGTREYHERGFNQDIYHMIEDHKGNIWLNLFMEQGLYCLDPESEMIYQVIDSLDLLRFLEGSTMIGSLFIDREGLAWIEATTLLSIVEKNPRKAFHPFDNSMHSGDESLHFEPTTIFFDSEGSLWIGTYGPELNRCTGFSNNLPIKTKQYPVQVQGLPFYAGQLQSIVEIDDENLGIAFLGGLKKFNKKTESYSSFHPSIDSILNRGISQLYKDKKGFYWIGTYLDGLVIYDPVSGNLKHYRYDRDDPEGVPPAQYAFTEDREGNMWWGSFGRGVSMLDKEQVNAIFTSEKLKIHRYANHIDRARGLSSDLIESTHCDSRGRMWIGTASGLNLYDSQTDNFYSFNESDGLPDECVSGILEDDHGNLWISTFKGICKLVLKEGYGPDIIKNAYSYGVEEGIDKPFFTGRVYAKSPDGWMYFGKPDGIIIFHPDSIKEDPVIPPVYITNIQINDKDVLDLEKSVLEKALPETEEIRLSYKQNFLGFEYVALNYLIPEKSRYKYMMEGLDEDWVDAGTRRFAEYRDLNPGEYTFQVIACNEDGLWNEEGASIGIVIKPPWYRSLLAYFIDGILMLAAIYGFIRWRTWRIRQERDQLELQVKERTAVIENQKEEILSANTILEGQKEELEQQKEEILTVNKTLEQQKEELEQQKEELQITLENLQQTQVQLIQSEKLAALGGLVAGVAHEINTPVGISVTAASSMAEETRQMAEKYKSNKISRAEFKDYLNTANQSAKLILSNMEKAATMIQSFKQVSVDQSTEQKRKFKLKEYSEDVIRSLYPKLKGKKIDITVEIDEKLELDSFPGAYSQVLTNLILNSLVHGFEGRDEGSIGLSAKIDKSVLLVEYADNGKGIPQEHVTRIFDPFFTTNKKVGTGLGLHIVHNLVDQKLNGSIHCESKEGEGVLFKITIPIA